MFPLHAQPKHPLLLTPRSLSLYPFPTAPRSQSVFPGSSSNLSLRPLAFPPVSSVLPLFPAVLVPCSRLFVQSVPGSSILPWLPAPRSLPSQSSHHFPSPTSPSLTTFLPSASFLIWFQLLCTQTRCFAGSNR